jgi:hypothetical protein
LWKERLQAVLCDRLGLQITVCHFPPGTSKWNPIEHRLFSFISGNCAGTPLRTWELFLAAIRGTTTKAGLTVEAMLHSHTYRTGMTVTNALMRTLNLEPHPTCPAWSYTPALVNVPAHRPQHRKLFFDGPLARHGASCPQAILRLSATIDEST